MSRPKRISDEAILGRCREAFLAEGLGASTRRLAQAAGTSEGVLFQRFGTKDALFFAAMRLPPPPLDGAIRAAGRAPTLRDGLEVMAVDALAYLRDQMPAVLLAMAHPACRGPDRAERVRELLGDARALHPAFAQVLADHVPPPGEGSPDDHAAIGLLVSALLARALHEELGLDDPVSTPVWLAQIVAAVERSLPGRDA